MIFVGPILINLLFLSTAIATDNGCETQIIGSPTRSIETEEVKELKHIFSSLNDRHYLESHQLYDLRTSLDRIVTIFNSLQEAQFKCDLGHLMSRVKHLRDMINGSILGDCDDHDLRDRSIVLVDSRFTAYPDLHAFIHKMNIDHATYCLRVMSRELSETIDNNIRPGIDMLSEMEKFRVYYEARRSDLNRASSSSASHQLPILANSDSDLLKDTFIGYLINKYGPIDLQDDELLRQHRSRFDQRIEKFWRLDQDAFCEPITSQLDDEFYYRLLNLMQIDADVDSKMDRSTHNWFSMLMICKRIKLIGAYRFYKYFMKQNYNIKDIEKVLLNTDIADDSGTLDSRKTHQLLEILKELYSYEVGVRNEQDDDRIDVSNLLDAGVVTREKCSIYHLADLVDLNERYSRFANLDIYFKAQMKKQLLICLRKLELDISDAINRIKLTQRIRITDYRHKVERLLVQSSPTMTQIKIWQLEDGERRNELFESGLIEYVSSNIGCKFKTIHEMRASIDAKLGSACQELRKRLTMLQFEFEKMVRLGAFISGHLTNSWMSSIVLCNHYLADRFRWFEMFDLFSQINQKRKKNLIGVAMDNIIGNCMRKPDTS